MTAKKKNPLKDLNAFLSQEASSLVQPEKVAGVKKENTTPKTAAKPVQKKAAKTSSAQKTKEVSEAGILEQLSVLKEKEGDAFTNTLHGLMLKAIELYGDSSAKEKMLINTLLFIDNPDNWRETVKQYWESKN